MRPRCAVPGITVMLVAVTVPTPCRSQAVPTSVTFQGSLTDAKGVPLPDGSRAMRFRLFDAASGGALLWDSGAMNVVSTKGVFSVALGAPPTPPITSATLATESVWVEVAVGVDTLVPRTRLASTPFALRAADLTLPFSKSVSSTDSPAFSVKNTGNNYGIKGETSAGPFAGVFGSNSGTGFGVYGWSQSGTGVRGWNQDSANVGTLGGPQSGVLGSSSLGYGVWGYSGTGHAGYFEGRVHTTGNLTTLGKMGIGALDPNANLEVYGVARVNGTNTPSAGEGLELGYNPTLNQGFVQPYDRTAGTWSYLSLGVGNVGIGGVDQPIRRLYVVHNYGGLSYALKLDNPHSTLGMDATGILFSVGGAGGNNLSPDRGKGALVYQLTKTWNRGNFYFLQEPNEGAANPTLGNVVMTVASDGNVGIGTMAPAKKLDVRGDASMTGNVDVGGNLTVNGALLGNIAPHGGTPFPRPAYDSGWYDHPANKTVEWIHGIGGNVDNYVVELLVKKTNGGITNYQTTSAVIWDNDSRLNILYGAYWHHLTNNSVQVTRHSVEFWEPNYTRLRIWVYR